MSPPSVFDRFGRMSTFPLNFTKQAPNGAPNRLSAAESNGFLGQQSPGSQATATEPSKILQCFRQACGCSFSDDYSWREHNKICHVQTLRYQCVFIKCAESFASESADTFIRHQKMHRVWVCKKAECVLQFDKRDKAIKHAAKDHKFENPGDWVGTTWIANSLKNKKGIRYQHRTDLELANFLEELEAKTLGKSKVEGMPVPNTAHPNDLRGVEPKEHVAHVSLPSAVFTCIVDQLNTLNSLLDHHSLIPDESESQKLQQALNTLQEKLLVGERRRIVPEGWNGNFTFGAPASQEHVTPLTTNFKEPFLATENPQRPRLLSPPLSSDISPSSEVAPQFRVQRAESQSEDDSDEDPEESAAPPDIGVDQEPRQETHLEKSEQIRYFEAMQKCCIEAAFAFYMRNKAHLDTINDRSSKPLCQTAKKGPIENATDLSLPHWTHLLRRISDARGLQKEMVSRIESFNGDIAPVDELQHAFKKEKVKSDRDLLALIQLTRNFCWQLKEWERCKHLDELYGLVDKSIRQVKRKHSQTSRKHRPKLTHGERMLENGVYRSSHRQSATWPRAIPDTGEDTHA